MSAGCVSLMWVGVLMASSDYLPDYLLRCPTCGLVYRMTSMTYDGAVFREGTETPVGAAEAVALMLKGAVAAGTCDTCYAEQVEGTVRLADVR